ncbi:MAG: DUF2098 family protein [Candidatus Methanoperedens sp.]|nr:DUF2098 family protein [Candidatus Methanoperedens sp.]
MHVGNIVLYSSTGTKGTVIEIISDDEGTWALVDKTNLYYKTEILKTIKTADEKEIVEKKITIEEVSEALERQKEFVPTEMDHSNVESGG